MATSLPRRWLGHNEEGQTCAVEAVQACVHKYMYHFSSANSVNLYLMYTDQPWDREGLADPS